jgi:hypothetical protein
MASPDLQLVQFRIEYGQNRSDYVSLETNYGTPLDTSLQLKVEYSRPLGYTGKDSFDNANALKDKIVLVMLPKSCAYFEEKVQKAAAACTRAGAAAMLIGRPANYAFLEVDVPNAAIPILLLPRDHCENTLLVQLRGGKEVAVRAVIEPAKESSNVRSRSAVLEADLAQIGPEIATVNNANRAGTVATVSQIATAQEQPKWGVSTMYNAVRVVFVGLKFDLAKKLEPHMAIRWNGGEGEMYNAVVLVFRDFTSQHDAGEFGKEYSCLCDLLEKSAEFHHMDPCFLLFVLECSQFCSTRRDLDCTEKLDTLVMTSLQQFRVLKVACAQFDGAMDLQVPSLVCPISSRCAVRDALSTYSERVVLKTGPLFQERNTEQLICALWVYFHCAPPQRSIPFLRRARSMCNSRDLSQLFDEQALMDFQSVLGDDLVETFLALPKTAGELLQLLDVCTKLCGDSVMQVATATVARIVGSVSGVDRSVVPHDVMGLLTRLQGCALSTGANQVITTYTLEAAINLYVHVIGIPHAPLGDALVTGLRQKLRSYSLGLASLQRLFDSPLAFVITDTITNAFLRAAQEQGSPSGYRSCYQDRPMRKCSSSLPDWLHLLNTIVEKICGVGDDTTSLVITQLTCWFTEAATPYESLNAFVMLVQAVAEHEHLFARDEDFIQRVVSELVQTAKDTGVCSKFVRQPLVTGTAPTSNVFHTLLVNELANAVAEAANEREGPNRDFIMFTTELLTDGSAMGASKLHFASLILAKYCSESHAWWPSTIDELLSFEGPKALYQLARVVSFSQLQDDCITLVPLGHRITSLAALLREWVSACSRKDVSLLEIQAALSSKKYGPMGKHFDVVLPDKAKLGLIETEITDAQICLQEVFFLTGNENSKVAVFHALSEHSVSLSLELEDICRKYEISQSNGFVLPADTLDRMWLSTMLQDVQTIRAWRKPMEEPLKVVAYFEVHKSALFEHYEQKQRQRCGAAKRRWSCDEFIEAVEATRQDLRRLFDENQAQFQDMKEAADRMHAGNTEEELRMIAACPNLLPDNIDIDQSIMDVGTILDLAQCTAPVQQLVSNLRVDLIHFLRLAHRPLFLLNYSLGQHIAAV